MPIESVMPSSHLILCRPLLLLPPIPPSTRVFSSKSTLHIRWPKYWSFSFSISPSNEHPGLIPFRMDWLDLLTVQGTLKSLLQHHSSKASIFWCSAKQLYSHKKNFFFKKLLPHKFSSPSAISGGLRYLGSSLLRNTPFIFRLQMLSALCPWVALALPLGLERSPKLLRGLVFTVCIPASPNYPPPLQDASGTLGTYV